MASFLNAIPREIYKRICPSFFFSHLKILKKPKKKGFDGYFTISCQSGPAITFSKSAIGGSLKFLIAQNFE